MKIAIIGAGALGAYFGARLHQAGHKVSFVARGAHLIAMQKTGLYIDSPNGDAHFNDIHATDDCDSIGHAEAVLFFVKNYDLEGALQQARPLVGPNSFVATFQNGISAPHVAAGVFGADRVLGGAAWTPGYISEPGRIKHTDTKDTLSFGALTNAGRLHAQTLKQALLDAKTRPEIVTDIEDALWTKFVLLGATSAISALTRLTFGQINADPITCDLMKRAIFEVANVARAVRPNLPDDLGAQQLAYYKAINGQVRASMSTDILAGKRLELDWFSGEIVRQGQRLGVPTPVHDVALAALWPYRNGLRAGA